MSLDATTAAPERAALPLGLVVAGSLVGLWVFVALFAPWIAPYDPNAVDIVHALQGPSAEHWFGTDQVGRDVFSRVLFGARIDLLMCLAGVLPPLVIGTTVGLVSGYFGETSSPYSGRYDYIDFSNAPGNNYFLRCHRP